MKTWFYTTLMEGQKALSLSDILLNFLVAAVLAGIIFLSYRWSHHGAIYSRKFNVTLVMLTIVTTLVMNVIGNNIALSLGMVGALSIVRFRTAVKDSRDTAYIFWAIAVGICCGVSDYLTASIGTVVLFVIMVLFGVIKDNNRVLIVLNITGSEVRDIKKAVMDYFDNKSVLLVNNTAPSSGYSELIFECSKHMVDSAEKKYGSLEDKLSGFSGIDKLSVVVQEDDINQ